jgi:hypothetical protein
MGYWKNEKKDICARLGRCGEAVRLSLGMVASQHGPIRFRLAQSLQPKISSGLVPAQSRLPVRVLQFGAAGFVDHLALPAIFSAGVRKSMAPCDCTALQ